VLYASFTLALSATSVLAASQEALPGDLLYPLKRQVESLRFEVVPAHLHHDLAAYELAERIDELARLTELGDSARAASMAAVVAQDYEAFVAEADAAGLGTDDRYLTVLTALLQRLPADVPAIDAIQAIVDRAPSHGGGVTPSRGSSGSTGGGITSAPGGNGHGPADSATGEPTPKPKPTKSPRPEPTPRAQNASENPASSGNGQPRSSSADDGRPADEPADEDQDDQ
jgi:hypothetical protein